VTTTPQPSSLPGPRPAASELAAVAQALAGEQAAVYAYGVVGAKAGPTYRRAATEGLLAHGVMSDLLAAQLSTAGESPAAAQPAYALPFVVRTVDEARRLAVHVEQSLAATYADLVAAAAPPRRRDAVTWLARSAAQAHRWGGAAQAFPGLPER